MKLLTYIFTKQQINDRDFWLRLALGTVTILLLVGQLFSYELFYQALEVGNSNLGVVGLAALVVALPIYELIALPSLLSMTVARSLLRVSAYSARLVSLLVVMLVINTLMMTPGSSVGLLGATIDVPAHIVTLLAVTAYAWGVWCATRTHVEWRTKK